MRKIVSVLLILCLGFSFAGCEEEKPIETVLVLNTESGMQAAAYDAIKYWEELPEQISLTGESWTFFLKYNLDEENPTKQSVYGVYADFKSGRDIFGAPAGQGDAEKYIKERTWEEFLPVDVISLDSKETITGSVVFTCYKFYLDIYYFPNGNFEHADFVIGHKKIEITENDEANHFAFIVSSSKKYIS